MANAFRLPDLGEGLTEGEISRWLVAVGDTIGEDDPLVEIQTDKTTVEIPSPYAGTVLAIHVGEGEIAPVGTVLVEIGQPDEALEGAAAPERPSAPEVAPTPTAADAGRIAATPLVRKIAAELGVDLATVTGTGPGGRITESDVRGVGGKTDAAPAEGRREPIRGVRRRIVEHLTTAHREIPAVTVVEECDFTDVDLRNLVPLTLAAVAGALATHPELNARLEGDEIVYLDRYDLGLAVQTDAGLVVPVVRDCDTRTVDELSAEVARLADAARAGTLKPDELRGSTFSVTSAGKLGGLFVTPLINHPEVGILGVHRIAERPVVRDGAIVARRIGHVSVTFDHRVVDGARAAAFLLDVIEKLQRS